MAKTVLEPCPAYCYATQLPPNVVSWFPDHVHQPFLLSTVPCMLSPSAPELSVIFFRLRPLRPLCTLLFSQSALELSSIDSCSLLRDESLSEQPFVVEQTPSHN